VKENLLKYFRAHTQEEYPKEACGFIIVNSRGREQYYKAKNIAESAEEHFIIDPISYADAEDLGEIIGICHSHPDETCIPSETDRVSCEATNKPWHILSWPLNKLYSWEPEGYEAPLIGRSFSHGVLDCYTLVKDYYKRELNIELQNYFHQNDWWEKGENLYVDNFKDQGFIEINDKNDIQKYDAFLIKLLSSVSNHAAIYIGGDTILHHVYGRLSNRQTYSGYWRKHTTHHLRHKSLC